jgi:hypothetical protein
MRFIRFLQEDWLFCSDISCCLLPCIESWSHGLHIRNANSLAWRSFQLALNTLLVVVADTLFQTSGSSCCEAAGSRGRGGPLPRALFSECSLHQFYFCLRPLHLQKPIPFRGWWISHHTTPAGLLLSHSGVQDGLR